MSFHVGTRNFEFGNAKFSVLDISGFGELHFMEVFSNDCEDMSLETWNLMAISEILFYTKIRKNLAKNFSYHNCSGSTLSGGQKFWIFKRS